jgi:hypothetical protein
MTAALAKTEAKAKSESGMTTENAHNTNVYVLIDIDPETFVLTAAMTIYGPFRSYTAAKDWGIAHSKSFTIEEIMRPIGVEAIGFIDTSPKEPTLEDQGIHPDQAQIGDYIDPNVAQ